MIDSTLSASLEDYLEAIFHIVEKKGAARPKDIADRLDVGNSSVTGALKALASRSLVNYAPYDIVTLTADGEEIARDVVYRHESLRNFFVRVLAIEPKLAEEAACRMEHAIPTELVERLIRFLEFVEVCPKGGPGLPEGFRAHLDAGCRSECLDQCPLEGSGKKYPVVDIPTSPLVTLDQLKNGETGMVARIRAEGSLRRRLVDLGLTSGTAITMERFAPLGDPLEVLVKGTHLSLRRKEAELIDLTVADTKG